MPDTKPEIVITYCTQCQWLLRAAWLAQELLSTFGEDLGRLRGTGGGRARDRTRRAAGGDRKRLANPRLEQLAP